VVNTVLKAMQILDALSGRQNLGVSELASSLDLPKSSVFAILKTLTSRKVVEKNTLTGKYCLGIKLIELGNCAQAGSDLCRIAAPILRGLNAQFDETLHLTVLDDDEVLYIDCIESHRCLRAYSVIGVRAPLYCTSVGKAILAFQSDAEVERIVERKGLVPFTAKTITTKEMLFAELSRIRVEGFAIDDMEHEEHLRCLGAPIFDAHGEVYAAISLTGPAERNTLARILEMAPAVVAAAKKISFSLGFRPGDAKI